MAAFAIGSLTAAIPLQTGNAKILKTMKNKQLRFAFLFAVILSASLSYAQMNYWTTPPYKFNMNPSTPTRTNIPPGFSSYEVANGAYDQAGNLLFYVIDGNIVAANGNGVGNLGNYTVGLTTYDYLQAEIGIVPIPGTCRQFYVIYAMDNPAQNCVLLYVKVDCSGATPVVTYNNWWEGFFIGYGGLDRTSFAISKIYDGEGLSAKRYLYSTSMDGIYKYIISSTSIASGDLTAPRAQLNLNYNNFEGLEAELSWNRDIFAWIDPIGGKVQTIRLYPNGAFIPGSLVSYSLGGAKGIEFTNDLSNPYLYVTYPFGIRKINTATQTTSLIKGLAGVNLSKSFLEYGKNGKIYGVSPTYDTQGNLIATTLVGIASNDTYSTVNAGFDSRYYVNLNDLVFTLPDQIDGDDYNYFFGNPYIVVANFTLNNITPSTSCSGATNFYSCASISFNASYSGGSYPSEYKFEIRATDANCNIITGQNNINYNSGWVTGQPAPDLDLRDFKDNNNLSLGNITGKVNVKYSIRDACGNESSKNYTILISSAPQPSIVLEIYNKSNPQTYLTPSHSISSPVNVGSASLGYRINNSTGLISYYKVQVDEVSSSGAFVKNIVEQTFTTNGVSGLTYENLNNYCARETAWPANPGFGSCNYTNPIYNGYSGYFSYSNGLYSWQHYFKLTVTVGNICGESTDYSYLYVETRNNKTLEYNGEAENNISIGKNDDITFYPNPTGNSLNFVFNLTKDSRITIELTDMSGRSVRSLLRNEILPMGNSTKSYNINDLKPGLYIYRVISESFNKNGILTKE